MNDRIDDAEDQAILEALEALEAGEAAGAGESGVGGAGAGGERRLGAARQARAYAELLGLLPYGLEPVAPSPEVKRRVMAAVRERAAAGPDPVPAAIPFRRPGGAPAGAPAASRWLLPLAAALALAIGLSAWLAVRVDRQSAAIAGLTRELSAATARAEQAETARAGLEAARGELLGQLALATSRGMIACPLEPMDDDHPRAGGLLFMSPGGGPWLLAVHGLEPPPAGRVYVAWFLHGDDPHAMGMLSPGADRSVQLTAERMPEHDSMTGVAVTLEPSPEVERPSGPTLLFGNRRIELI